MNIRSSFFVLIFSMLFVVLPLLALGQGGDGAGNSPFGEFEVGVGSATGSIDDFAENEGLVGLVDVVVQVITGTIVVVGLLVVVWSGYVYMTAGGNAQQVESAKKYFGSALLGIALAMLAFTILNTLNPQFASEAKNPVQGQACGKFNPCPDGYSCVNFNEASRCIAD